jgi:hypothetical protein
MGSSNLKHKTVACVITAIRPLNYLKNINSYVFAELYYSTKLVMFKILKRKHAKFLNVNNNNNNKLFFKNVITSKWRITQTQHANTNIKGQ